MTKHVHRFLGVVAALLLLPVDRAEACGGFFCSSAPMDQAGENIVYSVEPSGALEMHVQILYQGSADRFAWILPVPTVPQLGVGTDLLFQALDAPTRPVFFTTERVEGRCRPDPICPAPPPCTGWPCYPADAGPVWLDAGSPQDAGSSVSVSFRGVVGPYDAVVLSSGTAAELLTWLRDNGYDIPPSSEPIIQSYVDARQYFVALKLVASADTREIQPLVLRFPNQKPCLPIRLTAIATVQNLPITAYFLGSARATPLNYSLAEPNYEDRQLYDTYGGSYPGYIDAELNALGGQAFVAEYAGALPPGLSTAIPIPDLTRLRTATSRAALVQGLSQVLPGDAQLLALLTRLIPPPAGVQPRDYFNCLARGFCPYDDGDAGTLDPGPILDALEMALIAPRRSAVAMLGRHRKVTRLFTTMTAAEMTLDPEFDLDPGLSDVSNQHVSTRVIACSSEYRRSEAPVFLEFPSGRRVPYSAGRPSVSDAVFCGGSGGPSTLPDASAAIITPPLPAPGTLDASPGSPGGSVSVARGGCSAAAGTTSPLWGLAIFAALGLARRRLRGRRH